MNTEFSYNFYKTSGEAWTAMYQAISVAQISIYWEIYALVDDSAGSSFVSLLCQKAREGIEVRLVIDAFGSYDLSNNALNEMRSAGVDVQIFNAFYPDWNIKAWVRRVWHRTHRKILVIDEEVSFIGGVNVRADHTDWDDLHMRMTGKIIRPMLYGFAKSYLSAGGNKKEVKRLLHPKLTMGFNNLKEKVNLILHAPLNSPHVSPFKKLYSQALSTAKESFNLLSPYYVPDHKFVELINKASRRGVKVNILLPWRTDIKIMQYIADSFYGISEKAGAAFYFLKKMNHGKAVSSDNRLGIVGSSNFTNRSFFYDQEAGVAFSDEKMVEELNGILDSWKQSAIPLTDLGTGKRRWYARFRDWWLNAIKDYT